MRDTNSRPAATVVYHDGGRRFVADVRGHLIATDQPVHAGGADSAATPLELIGASLGSCIALYLHAYLETRSLETKGLRVHVRSTVSGVPRRIAELDVEVELPAGIPDEHLERLQRVAVSCPVHATLSDSVKIDVRLISVERPIGEVLVVA